MVARRRPGEGSDLLCYPPLHNLLEDFIEFSQAQYDCLDYDPFHPMLVHLGKGRTVEERLWLSMLYMAFYNIGSAWVVFKNTDVLGKLPAWAEYMPVGVQRRNLYGGLVIKHIESFCWLSKKYGSILSYLTKGFGGDEKVNWTTLKQNVGEAWGNGRWSVYTTSELYQKANKLVVLPWDIMNDGSSGPRAGLIRLHGLTGEPTVELLDRLADRLFAIARKRITTNIFYLPKNHYDYGMLESQLCDFNSMCKGLYYVGRDIDRDQERIRAAENRLRLMGMPLPMYEVWEARKAVFDHRHLGEFNGWLGRREEAKKFYVRTGRVADHKTIWDERAGVLL